MSFYDYFLQSKRSRRHQKFVQMQCKGILHFLHEHGFGKKTTHLLEIGLGQGDMLQFFRKQPNVKYFGMDLNHSICKAFNTVPGTNVRASLPQLPFADQSFDLIYLSHVIEHLGNYANALLFLEEAARCLKPQGQLVVLFPDYISWQEDFFSIDYSHDLPMTYSRIDRLANDAGMHIQAAIDYAGGWFGWKGRLFSTLGHFLPLRLVHAISPVRFAALRKARYALHRNWVILLEKHI